MRVSFGYKEKISGFFKVVRQVEVAVTVIFSDEQRAIIKRRSLGEYIVLKREADSQTARKLGAEYLASIEASFHLRIKNLIGGRPDRFLFDTPVDAKNYEHDLTEALKQLKDFIVGNATTGRTHVVEI